MSEGVKTNQDGVPVVDDLIHAASEAAEVECAGLVGAGTVTPVSHVGAYARVREVACADVVQQAAVGLAWPDAVHAGDVALHGNLLYVLACPFTTSSGTTFVLFVAMRTRSAARRWSTIVEAIAVALKRYLGQLAWDLSDPAAQVPRSPGLMVVNARLPDLPLEHVSAAFCYMTGYRADEVLGRNARFLQGPERDQPGRWRLQGALERGEQCTVALRNYRRHGQRFDSRVEVTPVTAVDGRADRYVALLFDVTGRDSKEVAVRPPDAGFVRDLEMAPVGKLVIDQASRCVRFANPAAGYLLGRVPTYLVGREFGSLPLTDGPVKLSTLRPGEPGRAGGMAEMMVKPIRWARRPAWVVTLVTVNEARHATRDPETGDWVIAEAGARFVCSRPDGSVACVSEALGDLLGYSRSELMGLSTGHLDAGGLVDADAWARNWAFVKLQGTLTVETHLRRRDGWLVPALLDVHHLEHAGEERHVVFVRNLSLP